MGEFSFGNLKEAFASIVKREAARDLRARQSVRRAARATRNYVIRETVPRAFAELAKSIHVEDAALDEALIIADAPHAAAVENGSRPHMPPIEPLIAWVKLRGMQGLYGGGKGSTTRRHATNVAAQLKAMERGGSLDLDAPTRIAWAIATAIAKRGTKPHRYMGQAVPVARENVGRFVNEALKDR